MLENYRRTYPVIKEHRAIRKDKDKQKFYAAHETDFIRRQFGYFPCESHGVRHINIVWLDLRSGTLAHRHKRLNAVFDIVGCSGKYIEFAPVIVDIEQLPQRITRRLAKNLRLRFGITKQL